MDMACPLESNILEKLREKRTKYQQLAFEIRERKYSEGNSPGLGETAVEVIPFAIGYFGGGMKKLARRTDGQADPRRTENNKRDAKNCTDGK